MDAKLKRHALWVHDARLSKEDLLLKADAFPNVNIGDVVELYNPDAGAQDACRLVLQVQVLDKTILSQKAPVSICRQIAEVNFFTAFH
jgi:hypothetical protein